MDEIAKEILPTLSKYLKPALLGRMNVIPYKNLSVDALKKIAKLKLGSIEKQMQSKAIDFSYDEKLLEHIVSLSNATETGARNLELIINNNLMPKLSRVLLDSMIKEETLSSIDISIDDEDTILIKSN
jgi:type VI secretion system protein VasG